MNAGQVMNLLEELKRRNVFKVAIAYLVVSWLAIQVVVSVSEPLTLPAWVPSFVIVLLAIGFPVALLFAWAYELTPDGVKRSRDVDLNASITHSTSRKIDFIIIGALVLIIRGMGYERLTLDVESGTSATADTAAETASIAVLPFVNMSGDVEQEYFADGVADEILNRLAQSDELRVISRSSSFSFKGTNPIIAEVANALNVNYVLEGSVRRAGNRVRITAQLIEVGHDSHMWSQTFERELTDIFAIEDEIAGHIAQALRIELGVTPSAPMPDMSDYEILLKARSLISTRDPDAIRSTIPMLTGLAERTPKYAEAQAQLAYAHMLNIFYQNEYNLEGQARFIERAAYYGNIARQLDDQNIMAIVVSAVVEMIHYNFEASEALFQEALEKQPNSGLAYNWHADLLVMVRHIREATRSLERAIELDPLLAVNYFNLINLYNHQGRFEDAITLANLDVIRSSPYGVADLISVYIAQDKFSDAVRLIEENNVAFLSQRLPFYKAMAAGDRKLALKHVLKLIEKNPVKDAYSLRGAIYGYARMEEYELVVPYLEMTHHNYDFSLLPLETTPEVLRANPAYAAFWRAAPRDRILKARGHWLPEWE